MTSDKKAEFLRRQGLINSKPDRVVHPLFTTLPFFDPLDLPQVRYEMLRTARVETTPVIEACRLFGFSREYFYRLERDFMSRGYVALLGSPRGRRPLLALNQDIVNFVIQRKINEPDLTAEKLRKEVRALYHVECSRRTMERLIRKLELGKRGRRTLSP